MIVALAAIFTSCSTPAGDEILSDRLSLSIFLTTPESSLFALAVVPVWLDGVWVAVDDDDWLDGAWVADDWLEGACVADDP